MCHFQVSSHTAGHDFCHRVLADYGPPIAAARPLICHGPPYRLLMLLPGPVICHGPPLLSLLAYSRSFRCLPHCYCLSRIPSAVFLATVRS
ncbi:unnamed protein product, partial [Staurois parvus]